MLKRSKRIILLLSIVVFCCNTLFAVALSGNTSKIDTDKNAPQHDISVMSFNVLDYVAGTVYAPPATRAPMVVKTIQSFMPDIIGIQEAGDPQDANDKFDWNDYLVIELGKLGYGCRYLTQESVKPSSMTIAAGLMIFYKNERFELMDHGSAQYTSDGKKGVYAEYQGFYRTDTSRYYHYVKLWDKQHGNYLYTFNTHLAVPVGSLTINGNVATAAQRTMLANITRTKQAAQLAAAIEQLAGDCPVFSTGDYNSSWNTSKADDPNAYQLRKMTDSGVLASAASTALEQISYFPDSLIDHVFYNTRYSFPLTYRGVYEEYGGYQPSDHKAMLAYFNYCTPITFASGTYDAESRTFTDTADTTDYTFGIGGLPANTDYKIFDRLGNQLSEPVSLQQADNDYIIKVYNTAFMTDSKKEFFTIQAGVKCTAATPLNLTVTGAANCYYTDGAYYVPVEQNSTMLRLTSADGTLYTDMDCSVAFSGYISNISQSTTLYLQSKTGTALIPVHVLVATAPAENGKVLYVDSRIGTAQGTVAFANDQKVVLAEAGVTAFATLTDAAAVANTSDGYTVYVAPGTYNEGVVNFTKNVTLLGNNDGISPLLRTDSLWTRWDARGAESCIMGELRFSRSGSIALTVRGFSFYGRGTVGYAIEQTQSNVKYDCTLNIAQNIFDFCGNNTVNSSCIMLNTATPCAGSITDNFFDGSGDTPTMMTRALTVRNPKGLTVEENYFINFSDQLAFITSEVSNGSPDDGYCDILFRYNRFSNCVPLSITNPTVTAGTYSDIRLLYNDFVECGNKAGDYALKIYLSSTNTPESDFSKYNLTIFGNRFVGCQRAIYLRRNSTESDLRLATLKITHNRFIGMHQSQLGNLMNLCFDIADETDFNATSQNWDFSHNYYTADTVSSQDPADYVRTTLTYNTVTDHCIDPQLLYPYYTDADLKTLSNGQEAPKLTGITVTSIFEADGNPHGIIVNAPKDAEISYSLDSTNTATARAWYWENPTLTRPGRQTVYFMVECSGYQTYYGTALLQVKAVGRTLDFKSKTLVYDGTAHALEFTPLEEDTVVYIYNGTSYDTMPTFTDVGKYTVQIRVTNPGYATATAVAILTIEQRIERSVTVTGFAGVYDGLPHGITVTDTAEGDTLWYATDGGPFSLVAPTFTEIGTHTVTLKVSRTGYNDLVLSAAVSITQTSTELFTLSLTLTEDTDQNRTLTYAFLLKDATVFDSADLLITEYGLRTLADIPLRKADTGIQTIEQNTFTVKSPATDTCFYVRYYLNGTAYEQCSPSYNN